MTRFTLRFGLIVCLAVPRTVLGAEDLSAAEVLSAIERGKRALQAQQLRDGSFPISDDSGPQAHPVGVAALATLALLNAGLTTQDPTIKRALNHLRNVRDNSELQTYDVALLIMVFAAARDGTTDLPRINRWAEWLELSQLRHNGAWTYRSRGGGGINLGGDPSNTQFAILGLREATEMGVSVDPAVWERARNYWEKLQQPDGGWGYTESSPSTGSMTVAGVGSMTIIEHMLRSDDGVGADGTPPCCKPDPPSSSLERGLKWVANHFAVGHNPGQNSWLLYYIYGLERAGRLSGRRFFGNHDWYREGAKFLVGVQLPRNDLWRGEGYEANTTVATSLSLLFLSKGLAPVMVSKLKHGGRDPLQPQEVTEVGWNQHPRDVRNLMEHISGLPKWPSLLTSQEIDLVKAAQTNGVDALLQAPILFITGDKPLKLTPVERDLIKEYLVQGGFVFASPACQSRDFETSFRELVLEILPPGEGELKPLPADHPVYRSEHLLSQEGTPLFGADVGCRTAVILCPEDLGCLWSYWQRHDPPKRNPQLKVKIVRSMQIGVNVCAYATGREPPRSLEAPKRIADQSELDQIERGLLQIAKIRHTGAWNAAPRALRNLLMALNETVGLAASTRPKDLSLTDPSIFQYPLLYMHGRTRFQLVAEEREQLKRHLSRSGVLFADACCGAKAFDTSFRELMKQLYPDHSLQPIPVTHEMFTDQVGHSIQRVRRRTSEGTGGGLSTTVRESEPVLEGVEVDGRYVVIYSKYDISCALERQSTLSCEGYLPEDAVRLAMNIVLYAMQQDVRFAPEASAPTK